MRPPNDFTEWVARGDGEAVAESLEALADVARASAAADSVSGPAWPELSSDALHGLPGEFIAMVSPHSEADPAALLIDFLVSVSALIGRGPFMRVDGARHAALEFAVVVGRTSRSRKGTSRAVVRHMLDRVDAAFFEARTLTGLGSGEGLIQALKDSPAAEGETHHAAPPAQVLVHEPEFSRVLAVCAREGGTLSAVLRSAWDSACLRVITRKDPISVREPHLCLLAHVTLEELRRMLNSTEIANGFANRFLFVAARRSKRLPFGGEASAERVYEFADKLRETVAHAQEITRIHWADSARDLWRSFYEALSDEGDGVVGALTARAEAHTLRLAIIYALLDRSAFIEQAHLRAAIAVWEYSDASVRYIFGSCLGDPLAQRILDLVNERPAGLSRTELHKALGGSTPAQKLNPAIQTLVAKNLLVRVKEGGTGGRSREVLRPKEPKKPNSPAPSFGSFASSGPESDCVAPPVDELARLYRSVEDTDAPEPRL